MTIEELQREIETLQAEIAGYEKLIALKRRQIYALKDELNLLLVEAWFQEHPDKRITTGDELAVTDEYITILLDRGFIVDYFSQNVRVGSIKYPPDGYLVIEIATYGGSSGFPLDLALRMRQAYLAQEVTS
jgi:hypothetical protein